MSAVVGSSGRHTDSSNPALNGPGGEPPAPWQFRALLWAFPPAFRKGCGADYVRFLACQRQERRYQGAMGSLRFWREVAGDAVATGTKLRMRIRREARPPAQADDSMRRTLSTPGGQRSGTPGGSRDGSLADVVGQDVRYGVRSLAATPGFTAVAVITLALGIGANTAIFTVVDSVLFRGLPYDHPEELVIIDRQDSTSSVTAASWPDFRDWRAQIESFSGLAGVIHFSMDIQWEGETQTLSGAAVTHDLFDVLGVQPLHGRGFTADEDRIGGPLAIILGHEVFVRRFDGDVAALGRSVMIDGDAHPLVGVMPAGFMNPDSEQVEFWLPMREDELLIDSGLPANSRTLGFINVVGRLAAGVSIDEAAVETRAVVAAIDAVEIPGRADSIGIRLTPLHEAAVGDVRQALLLVLGAVGVVLAIACANVANLSLSKASARRRELAIRSALGAPRARLVFQQAIESTAIALAGGALGILLAFLLIDVLLAIAPSWLPRTEEIAVNGSVLMFTLLVSLVAAILSGALPAVRASRARAGAALGDGARGSTHGARSLRTHNLLVVTQVAMAVLLLTMAALLGNSFARLVSVDPGFDPDNMVRAAISAPSRVQDDSERVVAFYDEVLANVRALPGVTLASLTYSPPFGRNGFLQTVVPEGTEDDPDNRTWVGTVLIGDGYFEAMRIPLLRGREFDQQDRPGAPLVVIVNQAMAHRFWLGEDPLGKRFRLTGGVSGSLDSFSDEFFPDDWFTVVGVAGDVRRVALDEQPQPEFYRPHAQMAWGTMFLLARTSGDPANMASLLQASIWDLDPTVAVNGVGTVQDWMADGVAEPRFRTVLLGAFALLATVLSMVGVYAVMAWSVTQRTAEIGVRLALGASAGHVLREVLWRGLLITAAGAAVGVAVALAAARYVASMLFEVSPTDPLTLVAVVGFVACVALFACCWPARRASRVDPLVALQSQ